MKRKITLTKEKTNQKNEGHTEKKIQHKIWLNDEIKNQQNFNKIVKEKKIRNQKNKDWIVKNNIW